MLLCTSLFKDLAKASQEQEQKHLFRPRTAFNVEKCHSVLKTHQCSIHTSLFGRSCDLFYTHAHSRFLLVCCCSAAQLAAGASCFCSKPIEERRLVPQYWDWLKRSHSWSFSGWMIEKSSCIARLPQTISMMIETSAASAAANLHIAVVVVSS